MSKDSTRFGIYREDLTEEMKQEIRTNIMCAIVVANCDYLDKDLLHELNIDNKSAIEIYSSAIKFRGYVRDVNAKAYADKTSLYPMYNLMANPAGVEYIQEVEVIAMHAAEGKKEAQEAVETFSLYYSDLKPTGIAKEYSPANEFAMSPYVDFALESALSNGVNKKITKELNEKAGNKNYSFQERVLNNLECRYDTSKVSKIFTIYA